MGSVHLLLASLALLLCGSAHAARGARSFGGGSRLARPRRGRGFLVAGGRGGNGSDGGMIAGIVVAVVVIVLLVVLAYFLYKMYKRKQRRQQQHGGQGPHGHNNKPHGNQHGPKKNGKHNKNKKQNQQQQQQQGAGYGGGAPEAASPGKPHDMAAYGPVGTGQGAGAGAYEGTYGAQGKPGNGEGEAGSVYSLYGQSDTTQSTNAHQHAPDEHHGGPGQQPGYSLYGGPPQGGQQAASSYPDPWHGGAGGPGVPAGQPPAKYPAI